MCSIPLLLLQGAADKTDIRQLLAPVPASAHLQPCSSSVCGTASCCSSALLFQLSNYKSTANYSLGYFLLGK